MEKHQPVVTYLAGFLLIVLGLKFMGVISITSIEILGFLMMIFGISYVYLSFGRNKKGVLFTSSVVFLSGVLIYITSTFEFFNARDLLYPAVMFVFSASFLMVYIDGDKGPVFIIMSAVFLFMGIVLTVLKGNFHGSSFFYSLLNVAINYWPVIFVAVVVYLLLLRSEKRNDEEKKL